jgi:iron complex outermembrane receptor protein
MSQSAQMATSTNQNIDYQPFILSVLQGNDLTKFGVKTLGEALTLVPGVDMATDSINNRTPIIRGSNPLAYGQTKLAINGMIVNDRTFDSYNSYLDLPIEIIERIEVIRGSGSFIEGINGYAGTINVITYSSQNSITEGLGSFYGSVGSDQSHSFGFWNQYNVSNIKLKTDLFYQSNDLHSPIVVQGSSIFGPSPSGHANLSSNQLNLGVSIGIDHLTIQGRINKYQTGSAFGNFDILPNKEGNQNIDSWYIQGEYFYPLTNNLKIITKAKIMEDGWTSDSRAIQPITGLWPNGYWGKLKLNNRLYEGEASTEYSGVENHLIKVGYNIKFENAIDMSSITTKKAAEGGGTDFIDYTQSKPFFNANDAKRHTNELFISDNININDQWALAIAGGSIQYNQTDSNLYGRVAIVYQSSYQNLFKLMAGNSFRLPSWQEMYVANNPSRIGNPDLIPEQVKSIEAQYIHKFNSNLSLSTNVFHLLNSNQITRDSSNKFQNIGSNTIDGLETELRGKITTDDTLSLSYSFIHGVVTDQNTGVKSDLPYTASHLIKAAYYYDLSDDWTIGSVWNYVGSKKRYTNDTRSDLSSYNTLDLALGWQMNVSKGWYAQAIIKNIGDTIVRYPSPASTYSDDYPISDRSFWIRAGWKF